MNITPKTYTKEEFLDNLINIQTNCNIVNKYHKLPEQISVKNNKYIIYINVTKYGTKNPTYNYEFNYYSEELVEFLFNSKVFSSVELSINNLLCDLMNIKISLN